MGPLLRARKSYFLSFLRDYSSIRWKKCYYETLGVPKTATQKEIRAAFVKLSKELHPDVSKKPDSHKDFTALNEAYTVLGKESSRQAYDSDQWSCAYRNGPYDRSDAFYRDWDHTGTYRYSRAQSYRTTYYDAASRDADRQESIHLVFMCVAIMVFGTVIQGLMIKYSLIFKRAELLKKSKELEEEYENYKKDRSQRSFDEIIAIMVQRHKLREEFLKTVVEKRSPFW